MMPSGSDMPAPIGHAIPLSVIRRHRRRTRRRMQSRFQKWPRRNRSFQTTRPSFPCYLQANSPFALPLRLTFWVGNSSRGWLSFPHSTSDPFSLASDLSILPFHHLQISFSFSSSFPRFINSTDLRFFTLLTLAKRCLLNLSRFPLHTLLCVLKVLSHWRPSNLSFLFLAPQHKFEYCTPDQGSDFCFLSRHVCNSHLKSIPASCSTFNQLPAAVWYCIPAFSFARPFHCIYYPPDIPQLWRGSIWRQALGLISPPKCGAELPLLRRSSAVLLIMMHIMPRNWSKRYDTCPGPKLYKGLVHLLADDIDAFF